MKNIKFLLAILLLGYLCACDDYLESVPYSTTSPENFYKSASDAEMALTGVYNILTATKVQGEGNQSSYSRQLMFMLNGATDECVWSYKSSATNYSDWGLASFTASNSFIDENWAFFYAGINRANYLLEKLPGIDDFSGDRGVEIEAEAKLLRGYYHMILSMIHGAIPVYTTSEQDPDAPRNSVESVYSQVISDYEFAYATLPDRAETSSHVNKWTAAALLAKAHTYLASMKNSGVDDFGLEINSFDWVDVEENYSKALSYTSDIIINSGYILVDEYHRLFRETTKEDQYQECMLTGEGSSDSGAKVVNVILNAFVPQGNRTTVGGGYAWYRPTGEFWYKYNENDIRRAQNLTGNLPNSASTESIDGVTYYVPNTVTNPNVGTYCIGKYRVMDPSLKDYNVALSSITLPLVRYADVLLLHAESQYYTGAETDARATLSTLRERAVSETASVDSLNNAYFKDDFLEELLDERARELCFENWRRIDLARFNKYDETIASLSADAGYYNQTVSIIQQNWKPERIWIPLPLDQIDLNSNLVQNEGF